MGFHGYGGHNACILGDYPLADCPDGPQGHCHSHGDAGHSHHNTQNHHYCPIVPNNSNCGPINLSWNHTATSRGTWSIGGQSVAPGTSSQRAPLGLQMPVTQKIYHGQVSPASDENTTPTRDVPSDRWLGDGPISEPARAGTTEREMGGFGGWLRGLDGAGDITGRNQGSRPAISTTASTTGRGNLLSGYGSSRLDDTVPINPTTPLESDHEVRENEKGL